MKFVNYNTRDVLKQLKEKYCVVNEIYTRSGCEVFIVLVKQEGSKQNLIYDLLLILPSRRRYFCSDGIGNQIGHYL